MRRKLALLVGTGVLAVCGFVGAGFAASADCTPGTICSTTSTQTGSTGKKTTTTNPGSTKATTTSPATTSIAAFRPTLTLSKSSIDFGTNLTLTGSVKGAPAGSPIDIITRTCGFTEPQQIAATKTRAGGSFRFVLQPQRNAIFTVRFATLTSTPKALIVRPKIALRRVSGSLFQIDVSAGGGSYFSKRVTLERFDVRRHAWRTIGRGKLRASTPPDALVAVSSARIKAVVAAGTKVRASASQAAVGSCYRAARSPAITG